MQIVRAQDLGYCAGVTTSVEKAIGALSFGKPVYTLGMLIHNEHTVAKLADMGIRPVSKEQAKTLRECVLVIKAHGCSELFLKSLHPSVTVVDATCPMVRKSHDFARLAREKSQQLIIVGDPEHSEIKGLLEDGEEDTVVLSSVEEVEAYVPTRDALVVVQTTFDVDALAPILESIKLKLNFCKKLLAIHNTICYTTSKRRQQVITLAKECDAIAVVGSRSSANTMGLLALAEDACGRAYLVESVGDIGKIQKTKILKLGIVSGASTPPGLVTEVITRMSNEEKAVVGEEINAVVDAAAEVSSVKESKKPMTMEEALASMVEIKQGTVVNCRVIEVRDDGLVVDCGQKKDGFVAAEHCGIDEYNKENHTVGEEFQAKIIENKGTDKSMLTLSKKAVDADHAAKLAREEAEKELLGSRFEVTISKVVKGGLLAHKGDFTIFIPASHIEVDPVEAEAMDKYVGETLTVKKLPPKKDEPERAGSKRIVASHKMVVLADRRAAAAERKKAREERKEREDQEKKDIFEANKDRFELNNIVPGIVKKHVNFGVFVNVYGFDCLCPTSEISWVRSADPTAVLEINKEYEFLIIKVDPNNYKVTLSFKQIQRQPYEIAAEKYPVGTIIKGTVQSLVKFGAFISIEPGIDGLVHISNISSEKVENPEDVLTVGQEIEAKVINFTDNRIALSIKDVNASSEKPARAPRAKKFDRPQTTGERKPKKVEEPLMSEEEKANIEAYGTGASATNNTFADMLKDLKLVSDDEE